MVKLIYVKDNKIMEQLQLTYQEHRQQYAEQHPASVPRLEHYQPMQPIEPKPADFSEVSEFPRWLAWLTAAMFIAGALVAGVHTVYEVYLGILPNDLIPRDLQKIIAYMSFVAIELSFFIGAFLIVREKGYGWATMIVAFIVSAIANVNSVLSAAAANPGSTFLTPAVSIGLGIGVPLIALMAGKMFVNMQRADRSRVHRETEAYRLALKTYEDSLRADTINALEMLRKAELEFDAAVQIEWKAVQKASKKMAGVQASNVSNERLMDMSNGQSAVQYRPSASTLGHSKHPDASAVTVAHLEAHPEDLNMPARQLAKLLGVGHATVNNVQREMKLRLATGSDDGDTEPVEVGQQS